MSNSSSRSNAPVQTAGTAWRRHAIGVFGLVFLSIGIYFYLWPPTDATGKFVHGSSVKSGLILLATWLAFPQIDKLPILPFIGVLVALLTVAVRPTIIWSALRIGFFLAPIFGLIWLLRPKSRSRPNRTP